MSLFEPQFDTILKHLNKADFGIAKRLYDENTAKILKDIDDEDLIKQFNELNVLPYNTGNWALERTVLQSLMETQKASVLMALNYLKIFGKLEYVKTKFSSGTNPETLPTSYISTSRRLAKQIPKEYEGSFTEISTGRLPNIILLGKYHRDGYPIEPSTGEKSGKNWNGQWPQYNSANSYEQEQLDDMKNRLQSFDDEQFKQELLDKRKENVRTEFNEIDREAQLKKKHNGLPNLRRKAFKPQNIENQDGKIVIANIEDDYNVSVSKNSDGDVFLINANLKPELKADVDVLINEDGTKRFEPSFIQGNQYTGIMSYVSELLPILLEDGISTLVQLIAWIGDTNRIIGEVITKHINNEYEFMDPSIKNRDKDDELRKAYYLEDEMIFNGKTKVKKDLIDIVFSIEDSIAKFESFGNLDENDPQMKFINTLILFQSLSMNTYTEMLDTYKNFLLQLMNPLSVVTLYNQFSTMTWLKSMTNKNNILSKLGSTDNTIFTTDLFEEVSKDWDKEITDNNRKFYEELINKYLEQVSAVYNYTLQKITL